MAPLAPQLLILDDDQTFARTLSRLLRENGYDATALSNGDGLLEYLAIRPVDLLILDLSLPGRDGFALLETIRREPAHDDLPVMVLSAAPPEEISERALGLGASDVVRKPFRIRELLARIRTQLRAGQQLNQARAEARAQALLVEILREVTGDLRPNQLFQVLVRRVAAGLRIPRCSILFARPGSDRGTVVAASENPMLQSLLVDLSRYPEVQRALQSGEALLVREAQSDPLYEGISNPSTTSSLVLPFSLRGERAGVFFLRTGEGDPPLGEADVRFATKVIEEAAVAIEKSQEMEEALKDEEAERDAAETDSLTGLVNRRALGSRLRQEVERATRYGTVLTCVMIDIDNFKATNEVHGEEAGDRILVQFAELPRREQRAVDTVVRYGGEEFVVLLPETGSSGARLFAERILRRVSHTTFGDPAAPIPVGISIGLATFPDERAADGEALLRLADRNLLRAKADGRNRYRD